jgi:hypothetical protein
LSIRSLRESERFLICPVYKATAKSAIKVFLFRRYDCLQRLSSQLYEPIYGINGSVTVRFDLGLIKTLLDMLSLMPLAIISGLVTKHHHQQSELYYPVWHHFFPSAPVVFCQASSIEHNSNI